MPQLAQRLGLDLADPLARERERLCNLLQGVLATAPHAEPHLDHLLFAGCQGPQGVLDLLPEVEGDHGLGRRDLLPVLDEVAEMAVVFHADRRLQ